MGLAPSSLAGLLPSLLRRSGFFELCFLLGGERERLELEERLEEPLEEPLEEEEEEEEELEGERAIAACGGRLAGLRTRPTCRGGRGGARAVRNGIHAGGSSLLCC